MRHAAACSRCRSLKRKCTNPTEDGCTQCTRRSQTCSFSRRKIALGPLAPPPQAASTSSFAIRFVSDGKNINLPESRVEGLVQAYLDLIHDRPHSIFHKTSLWEDIKSRAIPRCLLYSICSLGCSLSLDPEIHCMNKPFTGEAKRLLKVDLENVCLANVQTLILLANICAAELSPSSETLYFGIANRMAHILKLHEPNLSDCAVLRETKGRVWWTLYMADHWCSAGIGLPRQLYTTSKTVSLPLDDEVFQSAETRTTVLEAPPGMWAFMLTLVEIWPEIQNLNRRLVEGTLDESAADQAVQDISQRLDAWLENIPPSMRLTRENFDAHAAKGLGGPFVALHLGYHYYPILLYFQYLDLQRPRTSMSNEYAERCKYHASTYSDLLRQSRDRPGCEAVYATVGHMTVVSSSVLLHMLLFGREDDLDAMRAHLNSNFIALIEMRNFWPSLDRTIARLSTFQNACLQSADPNTHRIDMWMVRFLLEHSLPLDERNVDERHTGIDTAHNSAGYNKNSFNQREEFVNSAMATLWD